MAVVDDTSESIRKLHGDINAIDNTFFAHNKHVQNLNRVVDDAAMLTHSERVSRLQNTEKYVNNPSGFRDDLLIALSKDLDEVATLKPSLNFPDEIEKQLNTFIKPVMTGEEAHNIAKNF